MSLRYAKGRRLEYAVKRRLEAEGYTVFRCAASKPCDLIAVRCGEILLVECKAGRNPYAGPETLNKLKTLSQKIGATPVLAIRKEHRGIRFHRINETA
jgi:Holliday junction resolvase